MNKYASANCSLIKFFIIKYGKQTKFRNFATT